MAIVIKPTLKETMKFKEPKLSDELDQCPVFLKHMAQDFAAKAMERFNKEITITRVLEPVIGTESGVHQDWRAFDVRDEHDDKFEFESHEAQFLINYMNEIYPRNDGKLTCIHHSANGGPLHFHVQLAMLTKTYQR